MYSDYYTNNMYDPNAPNFTKTLVPKRPYNINDLRTGQYTPDDFIISTNFNDGNGRTVQNNIKDYFTDASGDNFDMVQPIEYDQYGRQNKSYLPYSYSTSGNFDPDYLNDQSSFYSNADKIAHDIKPFEENIFEQSGSGRVNEKSPVGNNWNLTSGHTLKNSYSFNSANEVNHWTIQRNANNDYSGANVDGNYPEYSLLKTKSLDEDNHASYTFYDKRGKIICKKYEAYTDGNDMTHDFTGGTASNSGGSIKLYSIYYVYDEFSQLVYTISIQNDNSLMTSITDDLNFGDPVFKGLVEANHYDNHGRVIARHVCDGGWEFNIYDAQDQTVLSQSPKLRETGDWYIYKYDALGRIVVTGISNLGSNIQQIQDDIDNDAVNFVRTTSSDPTGYSISDTHPLSIDNVHVINYYDNYGFTDQTLNGRNYQQVNSDYAVSHSDYVIGKLTASKVRILPAGDYLANVNYYNDDGRLIQQHKQNYIDFPNSWDVLSSQYLFTGAVSKNSRAHSAFNSNTEIKTRFTHDRMGRQTDIFKQVDNEPEVHLANRIYNSLGQLVRKTLHDQPVWNEQFLQGIDYRYNIRGWLTSINNAELTNDGDLNLDDNDVFGEQIFYENQGMSNSDFIAMPYYNGNISQMLWRAKPAPGYVSFDLRPIHLYTYRYDDFGRLTAGYYATNSGVNPTVFDQNINRFLEKESYDVRGNIQTLLRNYKCAIPVDDLQYSYTPSSNQLTAIEDNSTVNLIHNDFHNGTSQPTEYMYTESGNLRTDMNKGINLTYNFLNLPDQISGTGNLDYVYDATGNKLSSTFDGITHYYVNGIEYDGNDMQFITTEEGRIRKLSSVNNYAVNYVYDYYIKDHLGNIRFVLSTNTREMDYYATMESQNDSIEEQLFYNISTTRDNKLPGYPLDNSYLPDVKASELSTSVGRTIGHAKTLSVNADDVVHINTKYYFENASPDTNNLRPIPQILNDLALQFITNPSNGNSIAGGEQNAKQVWADKTFLSNTPLNDFLTTIFDQNELDNPGEPRAYLVWLFFSATDFTFVPEASGMLQATDAGQLGDLGIMDMTMPENGYLYVYVTNESAQFVDFDHLTIIHQTGRFLEENHYYPYGMLIEDLSYNSGQAPNNYKFNGDQYETKNNFYNYLATYRSYDPAIAKWNQLDPMNQFPNGYFAYGGNPVSLSDPQGLAVYKDGGKWSGSAEEPTVMHDPMGGKMMSGGGGIPWVWGGGDGGTSNEDIDGDQLKKWLHSLPRGLWGGYHDYAVTDNYFSSGGSAPISSTLGGNIFYQRMTETDLSTTGNFSIEGTSISGYFLEPPGPSSTIANQGSRIPAGTYHVIRNPGDKYGLRIYNDDVPIGRLIDIHTGNYPGDTEGCLLPGTTLGTNSVGNSGNMLNQIMNYFNSCGSDGFTITILDPKTQ